MLRSIDRLILSDSDPVQLTMPMIWDILNWVRVNIILVLYVIMQINGSLAKPTVKFKGSLAKFGGVDRPQVSWQKVYASEQKMQVICWTLTCGGGDQVISV